MNLIFETAIFNRKVLANLIDELSYKQLTEIPENFNNSIFWNIAHILVTQQLLTYKLSGFPLNIKTDLIPKYTKGSKATTEVTKEEIEYVKSNLITTVVKTQEDYKKGKFKGYHPYDTSVNIRLKNIDDALKFSAFHDGIHLGVVLSIKKMV